MVWDIAVVAATWLLARARGEHDGRRIGYLIRAWDADPAARRGLAGALRASDDRALDGIVVPENRSAAAESMRMSEPSVPSDAHQDDFNDVFEDDDDDYDYDRIAE